MSVTCISNSKTRDPTSSLQFILLHEVLCILKDFIQILFIYTKDDGDVCSVGERHISTFINYYGTRHCEVLRWGGGVGVTTFLNANSVVNIDNYSGPEGARVKVSPLFFFFILGVLNFLNGYKA